MLFKMGHLAQSTDTRASQLEAAIPRMIERAIATALTPLKGSIDSLTMRVEVCDRGHGASNEVTTLKADIIGLRKDVDQLKSTIFTSLFGMVEIVDDPSADILACSNVSPATTIGDEVRDDVATVEFKAKTDEEHLGVREEAVYEDLLDLEGAMYETNRQASLRDTSMVGSSGAKDAETP
ncbi:hypothetical protein H5410_027142 [Solanum commersonii]|uniref:Polyprotein protein n=1 Tax=Solanum commersonii TaxID=4109 RepID=A0A9J5YZ12_SOLCO|nr:hypothetical protein H5410_027142 [Solanum commersonii]